MFTSPEHLVSPPVLMLTTTGICVGKYSRATELILRSDANFQGTLSRQSHFLTSVWLNLTFSNILAILCRKSCPVSKFRHTAGAFKLPSANLPQHGPNTFKGASNLLFIARPTRWEGIPEIEPESSDPLYSSQPASHRVTAVILNPYQIYHTYSHMWITPVSTLKFSHVITREF